MALRPPSRASGSVSGLLLAISPDTRRDETLLAVEVTRYVGAELARSEQRLAASLTSSVTAVQSELAAISRRHTANFAALDRQVAFAAASLDERLTLLFAEQQKHLADLAADLAALESRTLAGLLRRAWRAIRRAV